MKKLMYGILGVVAVLSVVLIIASINKDDRFVESPQQIAEMFENDEDFVFVYGQTWCDNCKNYYNNTITPFWRENKSTPLYYIYGDDAFPSPKAEEEFKEQYGLEFKYVPATIFVKNGEVVDFVEGTIDKATLESKLESHNLK